MLTQDELAQIEKLIEKHKPSGSGFGTILLILFILGFFKGCGY
jgi:hypothetical protein